MTGLEVVANILRLIGLVVLLPGLWFAAGGMRLVVSGRLDERRRSANSLKLGLPLLVLALVLLFGGTWLANWAQLQ